jgi:Ca2+-binding RTX toxin-like protein
LLINTTTTGYQGQPTITALENGRFVVSWQDDSETGGDLSGSAVRGQVVNADGTKYGDEFLINTITNANQVEPRVTGLADGRFVVAWQDMSVDDGSDIHARVFNADGTSAGSEFLVNISSTWMPQIDPTIAALDDGRFVVAWLHYGYTGFNTRVQVFNADGTSYGDEFPVNGRIGYDQQQPTITALEGGRFVITWGDFSPGEYNDTDGYIYEGAVNAQVYNDDGSRVGAGFQVATSTTLWHGGTASEALVDGRFVVAWTDYSQTGSDTSGNAVYAQVFNADGSDAVAEFLVNRTTTDHQANPSITALADGRFVIAWSDYSQSGGDTSASAVRAQVFNTDGSEAGDEFLVNTTTSGPQFQPTITTLADGRFVVAWSDDSRSGGDTSGSAVRARIFDPRTSAIDVPGTLDDDNLIGTIFNDTLSGFFGNDSLRGAAGHDKLYGEDDNDSLIGNAGNDLLDGAAGNDLLDGAAGDDDLRGGPGSDRLTGGSGNDSVDGQAGNDLLAGGSGDDILVIDTLGDRVVEAAGGGIDEVRSATVSINLNLSHLAQVENARLTGHLTLHLTGSSTANRLTGNEDPNTIRGNAGSDTLTGLAGADRFVLSDALRADLITDFKSATDKLQLSKAGLPIGNGNTTIDGGLLRNAPGGFSTAAELVIFSSNITSTSITTTNAAAVIGSATAAYTVGATRLFAVDNGSRSHLYRFRAADANALVAPSELTLLADLSATPALALADLQFIL